MYGSVTPTSREPQSLYRRNPRSEEHHSAPPSRPPTPAQTSPSTSHHPSVPTNARSGAPPPAPGGKARVTLRFNASQESAESAARGAYYRKSLLHLGKPIAGRNAHRNTTGRLNREPPARCTPLAEVREEEDMARGSNYTGKPNPKALATRREVDRKHGERAYDSVNAIAIWKRLDDPRPTPPERPRDTMGGFDDDATELAMRGGHNEKGSGCVPICPYNQWRSPVMLDRKRFGEGVIWNHRAGNSAMMSAITALDGKMRKPRPSVRTERKSRTVHRKKRCVIHVFGNGKSRSKERARDHRGRRMVTKRGLPDIWPRCPNLAGARAVRGTLVVILWVCMFFLGA